jgi:sterol desaturase/sphingolipid hydroxylase (fatty acid hydroxylase superfamily)
VNVAIAYAYFHPVDAVIGGMIPSAIGPMVLGEKMHYYTYLLWALLRILESTDGHSGYEFPWNPFRILPFAASATYHDFHHSHNLGNYSSFFTIWDKIFGSNKDFYEY